MKGCFMRQFKKTLMVGVVTSMLMTSTSGMAGSPWLSAGLSTVGLIYSGLMTFLNGGITVWMMGTNVDAAQLTAETVLVFQMANVKDKWEPKPAKEYEKAAQSNGSGSGPGGVNPTYSSNLQIFPFKVASLQNVGIESVDVGSELSYISSTETRSEILEKLAWLQEKGSTTDSSEKTDKKSGAGSCSASYSVCLRDMNTEEEMAVSSLQEVNKQNYGTAGIAHAELGLKSVQQAIANDGDSSVGKAGASSSSENVTLPPGTKRDVQDLSKLIGTGANTVAAMKIVVLMNLELAQRLNQGNMMQGSALTIEASRAFSDTSAITD